MSNVFASLQRQIFKGHAVVPSPTQVRNPPQQPPKPPEEAEQKPPRKLHRSRQQDTSKPAGGSFTERKKLAKQTKVVELNPKNVLALVVNRLWYGKLIEPFNKVKLLANYKPKLKKRLEKFQRVDKFMVAKTGNNVRSAWLGLTNALNITNKELAKMADKNSAIEKMIKTSIAKAPINRQLRAAFLRIKKLFGKKDGKDRTKQTRVLVNILNRAITPIYKSVFEKLPNRSKRGKNPGKAKLFFNILSRVFKQKLMAAFNYTRYSTKAGASIITQPKKVRSSSMSGRAGSMRQSSATRKRPAEPTQNIEASIRQQTSLKERVKQRLKQIDEVIKKQQQTKRSIGQQSKKQQKLKNQLAEKQRPQKERQTKVKTPADDRIRAHPNDPIFFQRLKSIYLALKQSDQEIVNKQSFTKENALDFKSLFEHPEYILSLNRKLKDEVHRIEEFLAPSDTNRPVSKLMTEIQEMKDELAKQNEILRKSISKYVTAAYDTEWLFAEAKKLQEELTAKMEIINE